jgi:hypothetical protein
MGVPEPLAKKAQKCQETKERRNRRRPNVPDPKGWRKRPGFSRG